MGKGRRISKHGSAVLACGWRDGATGIKNVVTRSRGGEGGHGYGYAGAWGRRCDGRSLRRRGANESTLDRVRRRGPWLWPWTDCYRVVNMITDNGQGGCMSHGMPAASKKSHVAFRNSVRGNTARQRANDGSYVSCRRKTKKALSPLTGRCTAIASPPFHSPDG